MKPSFYIVDDQLTLMPYGCSCFVRPRRSNRGVAGMVSNIREITYREIRAREPAVSEAPRATASARPLPRLRTKPLRSRVKLCNIKEVITCKKCDTREGMEGEGGLVRIGRPAVAVPGVGEVPVPAVVAAPPVRRWPTASSSSSWSPSATPTPGALTRCCATSAPEGLPPAGRAPAGSRQAACTRSARAAPTPRSWPRSCYRRGAPRRLAGRGQLGAVVARGGADVDDPAERLDHPTGTARKLGRRGPAHGMGKAAVDGNGREGGAYGPGRAGSGA